MKFDAESTVQKLNDVAIKSDVALSKRFGYETSATATALNTLFLKGRVEVGYRSSCGRTDPTTYIYREWMKVVKAAEKCGFHISIEPVKHGNSWATKSGGFWQSSIYSIAERAGA
jgi:hypothetical protein